MSVRTVDVNEMCQRRSKGKAVLLVGTTAYSLLYLQSTLYTGRLNCEIAKKNVPSLDELVATIEYNNEIVHRSYASLLYPATLPLTDESQRNLLRQIFVLPLACAGSGSWLRRH